MTNIFLKLVKNSIENQKKNRSQSLNKLNFEG